MAKVKVPHACAWAALCVHYDDLFKNMLLLFLKNSQTIHLYCFSQYKKISKQYSHCGPTRFKVYKAIQSYK